MVFPHPSLHSRFPLETAMFSTTDSDPPIQMSVATTSADMGKLIRKQLWWEGAQKEAGGVELVTSGRNAAQINYSLQEESKTGVTVGNIAKDLGIDPALLQNRNLRLVAGTKQELFRKRKTWETKCNVLVNVEDVNDNQPEIDVTSVSSHIPEDAPPGLL
ncbi:hypothetical protein QQF64_006817 [Cirrhinus molitorella]|uniref:Cadherin N-terminal domain-containing protein n=1 Tax=Cirrhinus molitorella TaxID=172907 RepID=A0ABR3MCC8_9TELE